MTSGLMPSRLGRPVGDDPIPPRGHDSVFPPRFLEFAPARKPAETQDISHDHAGTGQGRHSMCQARPLRLSLGCPAWADSPCPRDTTAEPLGDLLLATIRPRLCQAGQAADRGGWFSTLPLAVQARAHVPVPAAPGSGFRDLTAVSERVREPRGKDGCWASTRHKRRHWRGIRVREPPGCKDFRRRL